LTDSTVRLLAPGADGYSLEISNVVTYSISCDPFPQIWAQTEYGFFRIVTPSPDFAPMLATMKQGVEIFTALMDLEEDFKRLKRGISIPDVKFKVCLAFLDVCRGARSQCTVGLKRWKWCDREGYSRSRESAGPYPFYHFPPETKPHG
jgi:hypothetical protein